MICGMAIDRRILLSAALSLTKLCFITVDVLKLVLLGAFVTASL